MFVDTHTHLYCEEFDTDREEMLARARLAGAEALLLPNIDEASLPPMLDMCEQNPGFCFPMLGLHPTELPDDPKPVLSRFQSLLEDRKHPYVAVGEVGIDLYWDKSRLEEQIEVFRIQTEWAVHYRLPLVVHTRSAHPEVVEVLRPYANRLCGGVFHCFGGSAEEAEELLSVFPNFYLGIGGVITFRKSSLPAVLKSRVPLCRLLLETDAPYLSPTPYRGKRNEPSYLPLVIAKLAEIYETSAEEVSQVTTENALRLFRLNL